MDTVLDKVSYKCNACGHKYEDPYFCEHCKSPMCPFCKRTGCIVNITEMRRMVSHSVELRSQMKRKPREKKTKDPNKRMEELRLKMQK